MYIFEEKKSMPRALNEIGTVFFFFFNANNRTGTEKKNRKGFSPPTRVYINYRYVSPLTHAPHITHRP